MNASRDDLVALLPAVYRLRDAAQGGPLEALLGVLATAGTRVEDDIATLYENWFVETCEDWVVPYLGDLVGVRGQHDIGASVGQRARTANVLRYRRRKGTATMLEQLARDATGWNARVMECFERLGWTQHLHHQRLDAVRTPDLRGTDALELLGGPFDRATYSVDVRRIAIGRGRYNIANVGIFLWRLQSYHLAGATARPDPVAGAGCFRMHPIGLDAALFNRPRTETDIAHLAQEANVPTPLRRRPLYEELEERRRLLALGAATWGLDSDALPRLAGDGVPDAAIVKLAPLAGEVFATELAFTAALTPLLTGAELSLLTATILGRAVRGLGALWFDEPSVLEVRVQGNAGEPHLRVPPERIMVCNLEDWRRPPALRAYPSGTGGTVQRPIQLSVDPVSGRVVFPVGNTPTDVLVSCAHGFSGDLGGGPYSRRATLSRLVDRDVDWQCAVGRGAAAEAGEAVVSTLTEAIALWHLLPAGKMGVIVLLDSQSYTESFTGAARIAIAAGSRLVIVAAGWPSPRVAGRIEPDDRRPHIVGSIHVVGGAGSELAIEGVLVEGAVHVLATGDANLARLTVSHCTLLPGAAPALQVNGKNGALRVELARSICGAVLLQSPIAALDVAESLVVRPAGVAVDAAGTPLTLNGCTVFGAVQAMELTADGTIVTGDAQIERRQTGCVRFSWTGPGSRTPRRFHCQPDLALRQAPAAQAATLVARLVPAFTSLELTHPAFAQLSRDCPLEIRAGAEDGAEMGAFRFLRQPQREANLRAGLDEYLRLGLEAGLIFVT